MTNIIKRPISGVMHYLDELHVISSLDIGLTDAFLHKYHSGHEPFGLPDKFIPSKGFHGKYDPELSEHYKMILREFHFRAKSYFTIPEWSVRDGHKDFKEHV